MATVFGGLLIADSSESLPPAAADYLDERKPDEKASDKELVSEEESKKLREWKANVLKTAILENEEVLCVLCFMFFFCSCLIIIFFFFSFFFFSFFCCYFIFKNKIH